MQRREQHLRQAADEGIVLRSGLVAEVEDGHGTLGEPLVAQISSQQVTELIDQLEDLLRWPGYRLGSHASPLVRLQQLGLDPVSGDRCMQQEDDVTAQFGGVPQRGFAGQAGRIQLDGLLRLPLQSENQVCGRCVAIAGDNSQPTSVSVCCETQADGQQADQQQRVQ